MNKEMFISELDKLNISYNEKMLNQLEEYKNFLIEYNNHTNLTAIKDEDGIYLKHFYDSLTLIKAIDLNNVNSVLDIGTGAGFPGMVIKIFFPDIDVYLLDSNGKKTKFLTELSKILDINDIKIINARAEDVYNDLENKFDVVVSRAVAYMDIIVSLSLPFVKEDGRLVLMKTNSDDELKILSKHQHELNISTFEKIEFNLPIINDKRVIYVINKDKKENKFKNYKEILKQHEKWIN